MNWLSFVMVRLRVSLLSQAISIATNTLVGPILAAGLTLFYFDQRVRKEGFDIEWMMQAAGMTPAQLQMPQEAIAASGDAGSAHE